MSRRVFLPLAIFLVVTACNKGGQSPGKGENPAGAAAAPPLLIASEDLITLRKDTLASGPIIAGTVQPERRADLRAEVPAVVLQVLKDNGEKVKRGDVLVRLDDSAIRETLMSAEAATRASTQTFDQTERQFQRLKTLRTSGMVSTQQLEDVEIRRNNAQSDLVAAKARAAQARQQIQRTEVRAPFDGVVSDRKVSAGDTAQVGKELLKVVDPSSVRFEGFVSADQIGVIKLGQAVHFRVNGYGQQVFKGEVKRIDPAANPTTRQVEVLVAFADKSHPGVSGLYAEGRIEAGGVQALMIPDAAVLRTGDKTVAWRVNSGTIQKVSVVMGERDPRRGDYVVRSGLVEGDRVVRNPGSTLKDGQKIEMAAPPAQAPAKPAGGI